MTHGLETTADVYYEDGNILTMPGGVLAAFSLRVAFLCNAALFCCGAFVAWRWLGAQREGSLPAEPTGAEA